MEPIVKICELEKKSNIKKWHNIIKNKQFKIAIEI